MNPNEYQKLAARTECNQDKSLERMALYKDVNDLIPIRVNHSIIGLAGEVGELASQLQKWIYYGKTLDETNLVEEFGDCLWYIALGLNALGVNMSEVMEKNIEKLRIRYPNRYTNEAADDANRDREAEMEAIKCQKQDLPIVKNPN